VVLDTGGTSLPGLMASRMNWLIPAGRRHRGHGGDPLPPPGPARITPGEGEVQVNFATPRPRGPGPGRAFYADDRLLGGGWIEARIK